MRNRAACFLLTLLLSACGAGSGPLNVSAPSPSQAPAVRQFKFVDTQNSGGTEVLNLTLDMPTLAGSALFCLSGAAVDARSITELTPSFSDDKGNTYVQTGGFILDAGNDNTFQRSYYAANIAGGTSAITARWPTGQFGDFRSMLVVEISGVSATPFLGHAEQVSTPTGSGSNNITSGNISVAIQPAIIIATSANTLQSHTPFAPLTGSGFASVGTWQNFGLGQGDFSRIESRLVTTTGNFPASFSANGADTFLTFAAAFK